MRKIAVPMLLCALLLCACSPKPVAVPAAANTGNRINAAVEPSKPVILTIDDTPFALPQPVSALYGMGFTAALPNEAIPPAELSGPILFERDGVTFTGYVQNTGPSAMAAREWMPVVWARFEAEGQAARIRLPMGLTLSGLKAAEVRKLYGEPQETSATEATLDLRYGMDLGATLYVLTKPKTGEVLAVELLACPVEDAV